MKSIKTQDIRIKSQDGFKTVHYKSTFISATLTFYS